jgi:hypothetical protein
MRGARRLGITGVPNGVPTFVAGGRGVVGAQPYEVNQHCWCSAWQTARLGMSASQACPVQAHTPICTHAVPFHAKPWRSDAHEGGPGFASIGEQSVWWSRGRKVVQAPSTQSGMRHPPVKGGGPQGFHEGDMKLGQSAFFAHTALAPQESGGSTTQFW